MYMWDYITFVTLIQCTSTSKCTYQ